MSVPLLELEALRARWRRARATVGLLHPTSDGFGTGGLGRYVRQLRVRMVVLPADPETTAIGDLDRDLWEWWEGADPTALEAPPLPRLAGATPTVGAAVRYWSYAGKPWLWDLFLALHRHGGVDLGLGRATYTYGGPEPQHQREAFRLTTIVGRLWSALAMESAVVNRFAELGPWQVVIGLIDTRGSALGNVATGWEGPERSFPDEVATCPEPNVLIVRELETWPSEEQSLRALAFELGGVIEDAWGSKQRRFLARSGPFQGTLDLDRFR